MRRTPPKGGPRWFAHRKGSHRMKRKVIVLVALLGGAGSAIATEKESPRELFRQLDTNRDRALQFSEIRATRAKLFDRLDANANGILELDEVKKAAAARAENRVKTSQRASFEERRDQIDKNQDAKISRDEFVGFIPDRLL